MLALLGCVVAAAPAASATPTPTPTPTVPDDGLVITTVAGSGEAGYTGDGGPATQAMLGGPDAVAVGPDGTLYVSDGARHIRTVSPDGTITTIAGAGTSGFAGDGGPALEAQFATADSFWGSGGMTVAADGTVYVADRGNHRIRTIAPGGTVNTVAGSGPSVVDAGDSTGMNGTFGGDGGPATAARLNNPSDVALGPDGTLYIADSYNYRIRAVAPDGVISTYAGVANPGDEGSGFFPAPDDGEDGRLATEIFVEPDALAVGEDGTLYYLERDEERVRAIDPATKVVTTVAGDGIMGQPRYGHATDLAVSGTTLYVSHFTEDGGTAGDAVEKVSLADGSSQTYGRQAEAVPALGIGDGGHPTQAAFSHPLGVATGPDGTLYVADTWAARVRAIAPSDATDGDGDGGGGDTSAAADIVTLAGSGASIGDDDEVGPDDGGWLSGGVQLRDARLNHPRDVVVGADGTIYLADTGNHRVRVIEPGSDRMRTLAGTGSPGDDGLGGPAAEADLNAPTGLALGDGVLYVVDKWNDRVVAVDLDTETIDRVRGGGGLSTPLDAAVDADGVLYVADTGNNRICRIGPDDRSCTTVMGEFDDEEAQEAADAQDGGTARNAALLAPMSVAMGSGGILYVADTGGARIRAYDPAAGTVTGVAGNGTLGHAGDGGPASQAQLGVVSALAVGDDGTLYLSDVGNHRVRAIDTDGVIRTVVGSGAADFTDLGESGIALGFSAGEPVGGNWGNGGGFGGDGGPASDAELNWPQGLAVDGDGVLYVADSGNNRIRAAGGDVIDLDRGSVSPRTWVIGGGVAVVVLLAGAAVVLLLRRRRRSREAQA